MFCSEFVYKNQQKLRCGYTTGTCAAAAAKAAVRMLLTGVECSRITLKTPKGIPLNLPVTNILWGQGFVSCAVKKDAGDDADCTNGILIYAKVTPLPGTEAIHIDGGVGIGRVTKPGLEQPPGAAAINHTPRQMIYTAAAEERTAAGCEVGLNIIISAPEGVAIAKNTFNPRLGIEGGISILGTSGIVEPMSEQALLDTIHLQMNQKRVQNESLLFITPGNYGQDFALNTYGIHLDKGIKCSNFIGDTLDFALELGFSRLLLVGHIGKLVKLAAGIMNTHSRMADARMEILCACALSAGADAATAREILNRTTTDDALFLLQKTSLLEPAMEILAEKILYHLRHRTNNQIEIEFIVFSNVYGTLIKTPGADTYLKELASIHNLPENNA